MRAIAVFLAGAFGCLAQSVAPSTTFEVASVKPAPPPDPRGIFSRTSGGPGSRTPERYTAENLDLQTLVMNAYDIRRYQVAGPDWMGNARFNITAKVPPGTTREQFRVMFQNLLAERFALKVHWETKEAPIYELTAAKGGPKLKEAGPDDPPPAPGTRPPQARTGPDGFPILPPGTRPMMMMAAGKAARRAHNETMEMTAAQIATQVDRPVIDATGLTGKYDYSLYWVSDRGGPPPAEGESGPSIFQAVQEQLGLKLESKRGPVRMLVIDHADKTPVEN